MIKIKIEEMADSVDSLGELTKVSLPIKVSYWISRLITKVNRELKHFSEQRDKLIESLGEQKEDGEYRVTKDKLSEYKDKLHEMMQVEIEIEGIDKISIQDLGNIQIQANALPSWLFTDEKESKKPKAK